MDYRQAMGDVATGRAVVGTRIKKKKNDDQVEDINKGSNDDPTSPMHPYHSSRSIL